MMKQLRIVTMIGTIAFAAMCVTPALAQSTFPSSAQEFSSNFWTERMMRAMDANKDGMVSRQEFMTYMGAQFDMMDAGKKGMLTSQQFMDKKMMSRTFMSPSSPSESGPNR
jgi:hypothetical protein